MIRSAYEAITLIPALGVLTVMVSMAARSRHLSPCGQGSPGMADEVVGRLQLRPLRPGFPRGLTADRTWRFSPAPAARVRPQSSLAEEVAGVLGPCGQGS